ncbi:MAG: T9SS type A sorting domain-containing protein, partial [Ignavibacteria bacterium]|nr:T9SS type A sorting domain-containing protein [Ignavibacteria bacterium]
IYMITSDLQNNLWFATFFGGLAKYNESQNLWTVYNTTNSGLHDNNLFSVYVDDNNIKWIGGNGLAIYNDTTWQIFYYPFIGDVFNFSKDRYGNIWICAAGGLYVYNPAGVIGIENNTAVISENYIFIQNYPNPFNPVTKIKYSLPKAGLVTLKIYDILGREVCMLINEYRNAGRYITEFDGSNLSSGVYFYKIEVNGFSDVKRMILVK